LATGQALWLELRFQRGGPQEPCRFFIWPKRMDCLCQFQLAAEDLHFAETALQSRDDICALLLCVCFELYKTDAYRLVNLGAIAGDIEEAKTGIDRKIEQGAN